MASYIAGLTDNIPQLKPFQPDLNFYANVLSTKQGQYDSALKKINSIYSSALNSPMLREDNLERRDKYFKTISQDLQKITGLDLSIDQNQQAAESLFQPILDDKYIINDMVYTKKLQRSFSQAEQFRNCADPDKCGGEYWNTGVQALNYAAEEFKNAAPDEALNYQAPKYVPFQNITKKVFAAAKAAGFNTSYEYVDGRYDVVDTNGELLLDRKNKDGSVSKGVLPQFLYGMFGSDPSVQAMFSTQAYVQRKTAARQFAAENGVSEQEGERDYLTSMMEKAVPKIEKAKNDLSGLRKATETDKKALEVVADNKGVVAGDGVSEAYKRLQSVLDNTEAAVEHHDKLSDLIRTTPNLNDIKTMRSRVDSIVGNATMMQTLDSAAYEYAMSTAKHEIKADPYKLAEYHNSLDLNKALQLKAVDQQYWKEQQLLLGKIGNGNPGEDLWRAVKAKGISDAQLAEIGVDRTNIGTPESRKAVLKSGMLTPDQAGLAEPFYPSESGNYTDTYVENGKILASATDKTQQLSSGFIKDTVRSMQIAYRNAANSADPAKGKVIQAKIMADAVDMFKGTGIDPVTMITASQSLDVLTSNPKLGSMTTFAIEARKRNKPAQVYNSGWDDEQLMKVQLADQTMRGLMKQRDIGMREAVNQVIKDIPYEGDERKVAIQGAGYSAIIGKNGILDYGQAAARYAAMAGKYYQGGPREAVMDFTLDNYNKYKSNFTSKLKSFTAPEGMPGEGGAYAQQKVIAKNINGNLKYSTDYLELKDIAKEVVLDKKGIISFSGTQIEPSPDADVFAKKVFEKVLNGDTRNMNINTQTQVLPGVENKVAVKVTVDDDTVREINGLKKSDPVSEEQKTFVAIMPSSAKFTAEHLNKIQPSPEDILLRNPGQVLSVNLAEKGTMAITKYGDGVGVSSTVPYFDEISGKVVYKDMPLTPADNVDQATDIGKSRMDAAYRIFAMKKEEYLKKQLKDQRSSNAGK